MMTFSRVNYQLIFTYTTNGVDLSVRSTVGEYLYCTIFDQGQSLKVSKVILSALTGKALQ